MENTHKIVLFFFFVFASFSLVAQKNNIVKDTFAYSEEDLYEDDPYFWSHTKEIGINFTPLISKFVPFNLGENEAGNIGLKWKKYYSKRAFRFNLGGKLNSGFNGQSDDFLFIGIGLERRHPISKDKKLSYTSGWDIFLKASNDEFENLFGIAKVYGFEYHFTKRIFISTEAQFQVGAGPDDGVVFGFQLPIAIFVNARLY